MYSARNICQKTQRICPAPHAFLITLAHLFRIIVVIPQDFHYASNLFAELPVAVGSTIAQRRCGYKWTQRPGASRVLVLATSPPPPNHLDKSTRTTCTVTTIDFSHLLLFLLIGHQASRMVDIRREMSVISY